MIISTNARGALEAAVDLTKWSQTKQARLRVLTRHHGQLLSSEVKAAASGRPGPNVVTGDYRRSIGLSMAEGLGTIEARVGTNKPQGRRLEYGFHGEDSRGRHYEQAPLPHFEPAFRTRAELFALAVARELMT